MEHYVMVLMRKHGEVTQLALAITTNDIELLYKGQGMPLTSQTFPYQQTLGTQWGQDERFTDNRRDSSRRFGNHNS